MSKSKNVNDFPYETPEKSIGFLFWQVSNLWQKSINQALEKFDLTHVQFVLLANIVWLSKSEENITQVRLAEYTKTNIMMTSKVVRTLEIKGFIQRTEHPKDTRAKILVATKKGNDLALNTIGVIVDADNNFFELPSDEKNLLLKMLLKIRNIKEKP